MQVCDMNGHEWKDSQDNFYSLLAFQYTDSCNAGIPSVVISELTIVFLRNVNCTHTTLILITLYSHHYSLERKVVVTGLCFTQSDILVRSVMWPSCNVLVLNDKSTAHGYS